MIANGNLSENLCCNLVLYINIPHFQPKKIDIQKFVPGKLFSK